MTLGLSPGTHQLKIRKIRSPAKANGKEQIGRMYFKKEMLRLMLSMRNLG